ncbi:ABC transporter ATP-binding protein [Nostocoides sp. Soil756]|jgi:iron(III) transport system ATP-binding protein|uniref:ABC transporter ATP-binding protein n=1 Tax=Nostocoides sp. Soil756 TaxID=1736399 RepID=UPI0006F6050E|nr:ABC transporter ATP-binding protein [Tetrasphaera sp. Soil756]KRE62525.1 sugar ABC transporter [Tetrasphaera sp. Soil756]
MTTLRLEGISASHPRTPVLHDIDLTVASGTTTAVLGPSGCGKTTLLRVVAGFMRPDTGTVRLGDEVVAGPGTWVPPERRGFGYVAQEGNLFPHLDVAANISYGLPRAERRARGRVAELLEVVGLPADLAGRRPDQLSGGQQQRVALARSLARRPGIVLLDEPFSALDPELRVATRDAVAAALRHERATVVLVTHDHAEALSFADQVAVLHDGGLVQVGAPPEVYTAPSDRRSAVSLGEACFLPGVLEDGVVRCALGRLAAPGASGSGPCEVVLRPEQLVLGPVASGIAHGVVTRTEYFGHDALVELRLDGDRAPVLRARITGAPPPVAGDEVSVTVRGDAHLLAAPAAG